MKNMKKELLIGSMKRDNFSVKVFNIIVFLGMSLIMSGQAKIATMLGETWTLGNWQKSSLMTNSYDVSGYLTNSLNQTWDLVSTSWINNALSNYSNNPDGTANQMIYQTWSGSAWTNLLRSTYTYTGSKKVLTSLREIWSVSVWQNSSRETNTYDGNGYLKTSLNESWVSGAWANGSKVNYTNNTDGTANQVIFQTWDGVSAWTNSQRLTYSYNASGKVLTSVIDQWTSGSWVPYSKESNTYDGSGYLTNNLSQLWDAGSSSWKDNKRSTYSNNPDGTANQTATQTWDGSTWTNSDRLTFTYSIITGISEITKDQIFTIYPNPVHDYINIRTDHVADGLAYSISNQAGMQVLKGNIIPESTSIDISSLEKGIYFLYLGEKNHHTCKFIKN